MAPLSAPGVLSRMSMPARSRRWTSSCSLASCSRSRVGAPTAATSGAAAAACCGATVKGAGVSILRDERGVCSARVEGTLWDAPVVGGWDRRAAVAGTLSREPIPCTDSGWAAAEDGPAPEELRCWPASSPALEKVSPTSLVSSRKLSVSLRSLSKEACSAES